MEANQVDIFAGAVLGHLEQIDDAEETGFAGQLRGDVREADGGDGVDLDLALVHAVAMPDFDVGAFQMRTLR